MKKIILFLMMMMLFGCTQKDETQKTTQNRTYNDGTYTTSAMGYGGEFQVELTLKDDKIQDIVVKEHNETPSIGGVALEQMIETMKKENTYDVDTISGATKTTQGLKDAVKSGFAKAKNQ